MKFKWWHGIVFNVILAAFAVSAAALYVVYFRGSRSLEIRDSVSGIVYGRWPVEERGEFAMEFIHSVNQSPVRETFTREGKMIRPLSVRFSSFGAGMQSEVGEGQTISRDGDALVISGFDTSFRELSFIVGTVSDHLLHINGETVSLKGLCGKNAHIRLRVR